MGELIRTHDWSHTSLGDVDVWPPHLKSALSICLHSGFPIAIYWGDDFTLLYNDAWSSIPGDKHPWALGRPGKQVWPEIWNLIEAQFNDVLLKGESIRSKDTLLPMQRFGYTEECYFDYTLSPIISINGNVSGVFNAVIETSYKVINERRNLVLHQLVQEINFIKTEEETFAKAAEIVEKAEKDIPFCLFYSSSGSDVLLTQAIGINKETAGKVKWPFEAVKSGKSKLVPDVALYISEPVSRFWPEVCSEVLIIPLKGRNQTITGYMVAGISPRKKLDKEYQNFLESVAIHISTAIVNINSIKEERTRIVQSEQRFRSLVEQATIATAVLTGKEMVLELANDAMLNIWDRDRSVIGKRLTEFMPELIDQPFPKILNEVFTTGVMYSQEDALVLIKRKGKLEEVYMDFSYKAIADAEGKIESILVSAADITEKVLTKKQLQESENNLRNIILQAPVAMCILRGPSFTVEIANERMFDLWGKTKEAILHRPLFEGLPEVKGQGFEKLLTTVYTTGQTFSAIEQPVQLQRGDKTETVYVNFVYEAFKEADGGISGVMAVANDVTEQVEVRQRIENSEASFRLLANSMPQFVWTGDAQGNLNYYNDAVYAYSGLTHDQLQKDGWLEIVHPDDRKENVERWLHSIATGEDFLFQHRFKNKDGDYRWQLSRAVPQKDEKGNIQLWVGTSTDIHDHKLFEEDLQSKVLERTLRLEQTNEALQRSNQELVRTNTNLEEFAYAASHDLKEPIRKIHFFADRLKQMLASRLNEEETHYFSRMEHAAGRMSLLIEDLLAYSHVGREMMVLEEIDLNQKITMVMEDLELEIKEKEAKLEVSDLPVIKGHRRQIQQLFQNLLGNALKYTKTGVKPVITISAKLVAAADIEWEPAVDGKHQHYHLIEVKDNGIGFEQKDADRIFNVFTRLHGNTEYRGTGVGLSIARKVVENHNGFIYAKSRVGAGSSFFVALPAE